MTTGALVLIAACSPSNTDRNAGAGTKQDVGDATPSQVISRQALGASGYWEPVPDDGVELGLGWDSQQGRVVPSRCVHLAPVRSTGQTTMMSLDEVSDRSDVMRSLNVSAAGSVKTMFASASGAASFARSSKVSTQSTTLLLNATVTNGVLFAAPPDASAPARIAFPAAGDGGGSVPVAADSGRLTFTPWALQLLENPARFRAFCGDGYVSAITSGARLLATFTFTSRSVSERRAAAASFKASYGPANVSASAQSSGQTDTSGTQLHVRYMQVGGAEGPIATTKAALDDKLAVLAEEAAASPRFQDMRIMPYAQMAEWRGSNSWRTADDEYAVIADTYWELTTLEEDVIYILDNYKDYNSKTGKSKKQLMHFLDDILTLRRSIYSALRDDVAPESVEAAATAEPVATDTGQSAARTAAPASADRRVTLFAAAPEVSFTAPSGINLKVLSENPTLSDLATELRRALPFGNAALLRINLPVPVSVLPMRNSHRVEISYDARTLQQAVLDMYITPGARRACQQEPTDNACLSVSELEQVRTLVPVRAG